MTTSDDVRVKLSPTGTKTHRAEQLSRRKKTFPLVNNSESTVKLCKRH